MPKKEKNSSVFSGVIPLLKKEAPSPGNCTDSHCIRSFWITFGQSRLCVTVIQIHLKISLRNLWMQAQRCLNKVLLSSEAIFLPPGATKGPGTASGPVRTAGPQGGARPPLSVSNLVLCRKTLREEQKSNNTARGHTRSPDHVWGWARTGTWH